MTVIPLALHSLRSLLHETPPDAGVLAAHLDALPAEDQLAQCLALSGKDLARLYRVSQDSPPLGLDDFVPPNAAPATAVRFGGKNSLPAFQRFEKHFARMGSTIIGRNLHAFSALTGPGYFTLAATSNPNGAVCFDYTRVPERVPNDWPATRRNNRGLGRLVYHRLLDYNRRVSRGVIVGTATRGDRPLNAYYVIVRLPA